MNAPFRANRYFTNRENHFTSFKNSINNLKKTQYSVLSFYGVGGIGKTRLKEELIKTVLEENIIVSSSLNFQQEEYRSVSTALYLLYKDLKSKKIQFPTFEIAHAIHWQKIHPEQSISKSGLPYIEEGSFAFDIISITQDIPIVGLIPKIGSILNKAKNGLEKWWAKNGERELKLIQQFEPHQIEEALPYYFALDLRDHLEFYSKSVVFFVDTYESLWEKEEDRKKEKFFSKDRWIRKLIQNLPQTLWVILGRERLKWDEVEEGIDWKEFLNQHLLGELSPNDANKFLEHCFIKEESIRNQIIQASKGLPFYLDLQVDTYNKIIENGNTPSEDKFGKNYIDILERFSKYLSTTETETLKILSCSKFWNYNIFKKVISEFKTGFPLTAFKELLNFSFITTVEIDGEENSYTIHQIMRTHLKENLDGYVRKDVHRLLLSYYEELLNIESKELLDFKSKSFIELTPKVIRLLDEILYHKKKIETSEKYYQWLLDISLKLYGKTKSTSIQDALEKGKNDLNFLDNYLLLIKIDYEISRLYNWKNDDLDALNHFIQEGLRKINIITKERYEENEEEIKVKEPELIQLKTDFLILQAELLQDLDSNSEAYILYLDAITNAKKIGYYPHLLSYSRLLKDLGRIPEAEGFSYRELHKSIIAKNTEDQALYYNEIGVLFRTQKLHNIAKVYFAKSLSLYEIIKGKEHSYCWNLKFNYAHALSSTGEAEKAQILLKDILHWNKSNYGETYFELGYIYFSLAKCEYSLKNYLLTIEHCLKVIDLLYPKFGINNTTIAEAQLIICEIVQNGILKEDLYIGELSEPDSNFLKKNYSVLIIQFEHNFYNNFENILKNFGYNSNVLNSLFKVVNQHYTLNNEHGKRIVLDKRKAEMERVYKEQFRIRGFEEIEKIKVEGENKNLFLNRLEVELGIIQNVQIEIFKSSLPYFKDTSVYHLQYSDNVVKYILENQDSIDYLDYTNTPIYEIADKKQFILSPHTASEYVYFFFDAVKGLAGKFYFSKNNNDIPLCVDVEVSDEIINDIKRNTQELKLLESTPDYILLEGSCFFKDSLFKTKVKVGSDGKISLSDEKMVLESLPIAIEPQFDKIVLSDEDKIRQIILFLENRFKLIPLSDVDTDLYNTFYKNIFLVKDNLQALKNQEPKIHEIFDDALYLMNKYIKPTYDNELVFRREIGQSLDVMNSILQQSELIKKRELIQLDIRLLSNRCTKLEKKQQGEIMLKFATSSVITEKPTQIFKGNLLFYPNTTIYALDFGDKRRKYVLDSDKEIYILDSTNRPIYTISHKDFILSADTIAEYVIFFFDSVIGKHGKFYIPISKEDIPYSDITQVTVNLQNEISNKIKPLEIILIEDDAITLFGFTFFKDSLFQTKIKVNSKGVCQLFDEELIMEDIPINVK